MQEEKIFFKYLDSLAYFLATVPIIAFFCYIDLETLLYNRYSWRVFIPENYCESSNLNFTHSPNQDFTLLSN